MRHLLSLPDECEFSFCVPPLKNGYHVFCKKPDIVPKLDCELREIIFGTSLIGQRFPHNASQLIQGEIIPLKSFGEISEAFFIEWLDAVAISNSQLITSDAVYLADLIKTRNWEYAGRPIRSWRNR
jgi:hypothetical protein